MEKKQIIAPIGIVKTPRTTDEIMDFIETLPENQRGNASLVMSMTWNFLASKVNEKVNNEQN